MARAMARTGTDGRRMGALATAALGAAAWAAAAAALAQDPKTAFLAALGVEFKAAVSILTGVAVLMGVAFLGMALREFVAHHRREGDGRNITRGLVGLLAGGLLIALPWTLGLVGDTLMGGGDQVDAREAVRTMDPLRQYEEARQ